MTLDDLQAAAMPHQITIEHGIPAPAARVGRPPRYPFAQMEPGDSFFVEEESDRVRSAAQRAGKLLGGGRRFVTRKTGSGVRVWRVA